MRESVSKFDCGSHLGAAPRTWRTTLSSVLSGTGFVGWVLGWIAVVAMAPAAGTHSTASDATLFSNLFVVAVVVLLFSGPLAFPQQEARGILACWLIVAVTSAAQVATIMSGWNWPAWQIASASIAILVVPFLLAAVTYELIRGKTFFFKAMLGQLND